MGVSGAPLPLSALRAGAHRLGIPLTSGQVDAFSLYWDLLREWNQRVNLTSAQALEEAERVHFLDSLTIAMAMPSEVREGGRLVDVGSGAGFPGLPLAIAFPSLGVVLIESVGKKVAFLRACVEALGLEERVEVLHGRAEELAHQPGLREGFSLGVARAVGPLAVALELVLPFVQVGGRAVFPKKGDWAGEVDLARPAAEALGGAVPQVLEVDPSLLGPGRVLVVVPKVHPTPPRYPRRAGMPAKRPLGVSR
ncbi:MAG: 16S rRNA (guanine(527)-N(7))-methyltransferase RsmG [Dehalococcoidia bacterium]|nr:16S rRNA (guanine(527)-N(7))-methyltransferase RsmG [Dehalococcoidia bacterium]MDW8119485.1 16S rRNA (guanine(527)-N(7))-methyltransferase RsmG [Chloroflexota bacterium]